MTPYFTDEDVAVVIQLRWDSNSDNKPPTLESLYLLLKPRHSEDE